MLSLPIDDLMRNGIKANVFPGAVLWVSRHQEIIYKKAFGYANIFSRDRMTLDTVFDLASLTKPLATTLAIVRLIEQNRVGLDTPLSEIIEDFQATDKSSITIRHLLCHTSGLPDYQPYYMALSDYAPKEKQKALRERLVAESLAGPVGGQTIYSDLGFMILCWVIETITGVPLDQYVQNEIYTPMGLSGLFFIRLPSKPFQGEIAATENCPWRRNVLRGEVHDDNAWSVGGVDGHAGLFGTAASVHALLTELLDSYLGKGEPRFFQTNLIRLFLTRTSGGRAFGFDVPNAEGASCGRHFSYQSVGHLGFTGTSFWMDLAKQVIVILLTNRVHPSRDNTQIREFRPILHDTVMENIDD